MADAEPKTGRRWVVPALAAVLGVALGLTGVSLVRASGRTVHVVNGSAIALRVRVEGGAAVEVRPGGRALLSVAEGAHEAVVEDAVQSALGAAPLERFTFTLEGAFAERLLDTTVFVLNPLHAAALVRDRTFYGPEESGVAAAAPEVLLGKHFYALPDVDVVFAPLPEEGAGWRTRVDQLHEVPQRVLALVPPERRTSDETLRYVEAHLLRGHAARAVDEGLLRVYQGLTAADPTRARDLLASGLDRSPPSVPWHRAYQDARRALGEADALRAEYAERLRADPERSELLYLAGRVAEDPDAARSLYSRARAADPQNGFAWYAEAVLAYRRAEFSAANEAIARAAELRPADPAVAAWRYETRFATGEHEALLAELREAGAQAPLDFALHLRLLEVLAARGELPAAREAQQQYRQRVALHAPSDPQQLALLSEISLRYLEGDLEAMLERAGALRVPAVRDRLRFDALLELGRLDEAAKLAEATSSSLEALLLAVAAEQPELRARWLTTARERLAAGPPAEQRAAALLERPAEAELAHVLPLAIGPEPKAALLCALAAARPLEARAPLLDAARRYNHRPRFPHRVLEKAVEALGAR